MTEGRPAEVLALFPAFESAVFGGVQAAGREAWQAVETSFPGAAEAFFYEPGSSKLGALARALGQRRAKTLLVWHCGLLKLAPFLGLLASGPKMRRVVFLHGVEVWRTHDGFTSSLLVRSDLFLSNSDHTWRRFLEFHPACSRIPHKTVPLGIGDPITGKGGMPSGPPAALMIGRMQRDENYKGHREMIGAWPKIREAMPGAELWIVGGGDLRPELERQTEALGLRDAVKFFGAIPEEAKQNLIRRCRVFAMPSAGEGFGLAYLEAMRMGRPCIVSRLDAGAEVVNPPEAGLSVELKDADEISAAVLRFLTPGEAWDETSLRAKRRYEALFTGPEFQRRLIAALDAPSFC